MNRNTWALTLIGSLVLLLILGPAVRNLVEGFSQNGGGSSDGGLFYSSYFTPWWRSYYPGPYYGTSATSYDQLLNWPYSSFYWRKPGNYYNYWSYWRRPQYNNYWRQPYFNRRKVYRPYLRDSIIGRRQRKKLFNFNGLREEASDAQVGLQKAGSFKYGTFRDYR